MKVLLLNPLYQVPVSKQYVRYFVRTGSRWPHSGIKSKAVLAHYRPFPFSLAYAAAYLKKAGLEIEAIDALALNMPQEQLLSEIARIKPDLIFYELITPTVDHDLELARKIKQITPARVALGGLHAAYFAPYILRENSAVDFIIGADYESVLAQLAQKMQAGDLDVPGVLRRLADGSLAGQANLDNFLAPDELIRPLREIFPANDRADPALYWDGFCQIRPCIQLQGSRGCLGRCSFCLSSAKITKLQKTDIEQLCGQIQEAVEKYGAQEIYFDDDDFIQDIYRTTAIFGALEKRNLRIKWSAMSSFSSLDSRIIRQLAAWGCIGLKIGVESADSAILQEMHKPLDAAKAKQAIRECRKLGIKTHLTFIIGSLQETAGQIAQTAVLSKELDADSIQVSIATPFPGTEFYRKAQEAGLLNNAAWEDYDGKRKSVIRESLAGITLGMMRKEFLKSWLLRRVFSLPWLLRHWRVIRRTLAGTGAVFFFKQLAATYVDENKNR